MSLRDRWRWVMRAVALAVVTASLAVLAAWGVSWALHADLPGRLAEAEMRLRLWIRRSL